MKKLMLFFSVLFSLLYSSQAQTTVNVAATARQTFKHFGVNVTQDDARSYNMPAAVRATMLQMQYEGLKTNAVRIWGGYSPLSNARLDFYKNFIIATEKPMGLDYVHIVGGPGEKEPVGFNYYDHGKQMADFVKNCRDRGLQIDGIAWNNEPGMYQPFIGAPNYSFRIPEMPKVAKGFKDQANTLGLTNIKFVMGDYANSDNWFVDAIDAVVADPAALSATDAFSCHSYSNSPQKIAGDKILAAGKEFHQNESADGDGNSRTDDAGENFRCISRYISDLNHGVSDWYWFIGIHGKDMNDLGNGVYDAGVENLKIALINYAPNLGKIIAFPRYYYFKHVNAVLPKGTVMRSCTGANGVDIGFNSNQVMNGQKVVATVGKRPDNKMVVVLTSEVAQTININIAELAGTGTKTFTVLKSSIGSYEQNGGTINVTNGSVSIQAAQYELITLLENAGPAVQVTGVSVTPTTASVAAGATTSLTATIAPANATNKNVTWSSSNTAIATVSTTGIVTGVAAGTATITVTTTDGNKTATCVVTVTSAGAGVNVPAKIEAENFAAMSGVQTQSTTDVGGGQNVGYIDQNDWIDYAINVPTAGTYTTDFRLASVNSGRQFQMKVGATILTTVTVPQTGGWQNWQTVTASVNLSAGAQTIRLLASNGNGWNINWFEIKGSSSVAVTGVTLSPTTASVVTSATTTLSAAVAPVNATNKNVTWSSSNTAIATVSTTGIVTGSATGTATITVTTQDGNKTATCIVTVTSGAGSASIYEAESGTYGGGGQTQNASNASNGQVVGNLNAFGSYSQVASVNGGSGGAGSLVIRYSNGFSSTSAIGLYVNNTFIQNVFFPVTGGWNTFADATVSINLSSGTGNTIKLQIGSGNAAADIDKYTVTPNGTTNVSVTSVAVLPTTASIVTGATTTLTGTVAPANATNKNVTWSSSNTGIATVNATGVVTGVATGTATITVTTIDGNKTAICAITVTTAGTGSELIGTVIGTGGSGTSGATNDKVFDGNFTTFYDATTANGAWVGLDLGSAKVISTVKFAPRVSWASRMNGGKIQGSNTANFSVATDLFTISSNPAENVLTVGTVSNTTAFRYVRYLSPNNGYCNISELAFFGVSGLKPAKSVSAPMEIQSPENMQVTAFPNPGNASDIKIVLAGYQNQKNILLRMTDLSGRVVFKRTLQGQGLKIQSTTLGRSGLTKGIYTITVESNKLIKSTRLLLQ